MKFTKILSTMAFWGLSTTVTTTHAFTFPTNSQTPQQQRTNQRLSSTMAATNGESTQINGFVSDDNNKPHIRLNVSEKAKTVISVCHSGTLCTTSTNNDIAGAPFGSYVDYVLDEDGCPILLMNEMSMHTMNIASNPEGFVTLFAQLGGSSNPQGGASSSSSSQGADSSSSKSNKGQDVSRCSITGTVEKISEEDPSLDSIRMKYSITHVYADQVMDSPKFAFYRIVPAKVYFVGGFGVLAKWIPVEEYTAAASDILAEESLEIVSKLNNQHTQDLKLTAQYLLECVGVEQVRVTSIDRLGMDVRVTQKGKRRNTTVTDEFRIGFRIPVLSVEDAKSEVLKVFQEAWEVANGYTWGEDDNEPGSDVPIAKFAADDLGLN